MAPIQVPTKRGGAVAPPRCVRIHGMDTLRGVCILLMVLFHFGYDLYFYCSFPAWVVSHPLMSACQILSSRGFILLAGFSCHLSRSNLKRGVKVLACGLLVAAVTALWGDSIRFGILHFLGCAMILYGLTRSLWDRIPKAAAPVFYLGAFFLLKHLFPITVGAGWLYPLGFLPTGFYSSDYWPLLPWFFFFLLGTWLGRFRERIPARFADLRLPLLNVLGRHSLAVYLIHQPVLVGISLVLVFLTGGSFSVR